MHQLVLELYPWLVAFFLLDGVVDLRGGQLLFAQLGAGGFRVLGAGLHHFGPWPSAEVIGAIDLTWVSDARGPSFLDPARRFDPPVLAPEDWTQVSWEELAVEREGRKVKGAGRTLVATPDPALAARVVAALAAAAAAAPAERSRVLVERGTPSGDVKAIRALRARQRPLRLGLAAAASALFVATFGLGGAIAFGVPGAERLTEPLLVAIGVLVLLEVPLAFGLVRTGGGSLGAAARAAAGLLAWPVSALHPLLHLSRGAWAGYSPAALAVALLPRAEAEHWLARALGQAAVSLSAAGEGPLAAGLRARERALCDAARAGGIDPAALRAPPAREADEAAWCPTCRARFLAGPVCCADCRVELVPYEAPQRSI